MQVGSDGKPDGGPGGPGGGGRAAAEVPAKPGDILQPYDTGFGPVTQTVTAGQIFSGAAPLANDVTIRIGAIVAAVSFAGLSGTGLNQVNLNVPQMANGDYDVIAETGGVVSKAGVKLRIQA